MDDTAAEADVACFGADGRTIGRFGKVPVTERIAICAEDGLPMLAVAAAVTAQLHFGVFARVRKAWRVR